MKAIKTYSTRVEADVARIMLGFILEMQALTLASE